MNVRSNSWRRNVLQGLRVPVKWTAHKVSRVSAKLPVLDRWLSVPACGVMHLYRSMLSRAKGFRCAHAAVTGGPSCSDVALQAFRERPFAAAIGEIDAQFERCRASLMRFDSDLIGQAIASLPTFAADAQCCDQDGDGVIDCCDFNTTPDP